jgi:triosephosphate isomerase
MSKKKIVIANWKMKPDLPVSLKLAQDYKEKFGSAPIENKEVVACPSLVVLNEIGKIMQDSIVQLGAQNVFWEEQGAYTGEVSAKMLEQAGCRYVIIGHSERRQYLLENYQMIHQKLKEVLNNSGLIPIICIGETLKEKETGKRDYVIVDQLQQAFSGIDFLSGQQAIVAYEPVWAIGTGQVITPEDVENMHEIIRAALVDLFGVDVINQQVRIIYGGSVDSANVTGFSKLDNIDGLLVGGASLKAEEFLQIVKGI